MKKGLLILIIVLFLPSSVLSWCILGIGNTCEEEITPAEQSFPLISSGGSDNWKITATDAEENLNVEYTILDERTTEFCIDFKDKETYEDTLSLSAKDITTIPIIKTDEKDSSFLLEKETIDLTNADKEKQCFTITYEEFKSGMEFKIGWNTVVIRSTTEGSVARAYSFIHQIYYDSVNNRWQTIYVYNDSNDPYTSSSADGETWEVGIEMGRWANSIASFGDFDCIRDNTNKEMVHCVYGLGSYDYIEYRRCNSTGTSPYLVCETEQTIYDSSDTGADANNDMMSIRAAQDSNGCLLVAFVMRNATEGAANDHTICLTKEKAPCGDGVWNGAADTETGFPVFNIQNVTEDPYANPTTMGISSFGDLDAQLVWIDTDDYGAYDLETIFFDGDTNTFGTQDTLDPDIEWSTGFTTNTMVIIGEKTIIFGADDGTTDIDAYELGSKDNTTNSQADTGLDVAIGTTDVHVGTMVAVVDTEADGSDDIWLFAVDDDDQQDIAYVVSTDGGATWGDATLWQDDPDGTNEIKFMDAFFNEETCDIMVRWLEGSASPFNITTDIINTGSCEAAPDTCTYSGTGNWIVDCADNCNIASKVTGDGSALSITGVGTFTVESEVEVKGFSTITTKDCIVRWKII